MSNQKIEADLMKQVAADPDDDTPRLIMADWYDEQGDPRGQFIRAQCEMETLDWDTPRFDQLENEVDVAITKHRAKWVRALPKLPGITWGNFNRAMHNGMWDEGRYYFRRGFVELLAIRDTKSLKKHLSAVRQYGLAAYPEVVSGQASCYEQLYRESYIRGIGFFQQFDGVDFDGIEGMTSRDKLRVLSLNECDLGQEEAKRLTSIEFPALRSLDLHFNDLERSIDTLCAWPVFKDLRCLDLSLNSLGDVPGSLKRLMSEPALANLSSLSLWSNELTAKDFRSAARTCVMKRLTSLDLSSNRMGDDGVAAMLKLPLSSLRILELSTSDITSEGVQFLAKSKKLKNLRRLNVGHNDGVGDPGIAAIAESHHLSQLTHLNLARTKLGEKGAEALIESQSLQSMRQLNIGMPKLKPATIKALQKRYPKAIKKEPYR